jgi:hypothetical protein
MTKIIRKFIPLFLHHSLALSTLPPCDWIVKKVRALHLVQLRSVYQLREEIGFWF